ncbi:GAF domain-containing protein [Actinomadura sp. DC4]|uniref:GAF domain-containing protein n=1 Tax=Actinomadura sp. DC4 TaxID=3055069 RepID=UPI0025B10003|nr:GAF domain-containing protein [Actinomadura sp. DC4]MDN3352275.1 GAF domain-containing protein [Actinomadura sp. DC4]
MGESRADRIWASIAGYAVGGTVSVGSLCAACVPVLGVDGAALWLASDLNRRLLMHATDPVSKVLHEAQFTLGEGPCVQAWTERTMVLAPDLAAGDAAILWPMFVPAAVTAGAGAVFAFPLQVGAIRVGVLDLYRVRPGPLEDAQLADALTFASAALHLVLHQSRADADGVAEPEQRWPHGGLSSGQVEIYQATGMVAAQLDAGLEEALLRLRAYAFAHEISIGRTARLVIDRRLRFSGEDDD